MRTLDTVRGWEGYRVRILDFILVIEVLKSIPTVTCLQCDGSGARLIF